MYTRTTKQVVVVRLEGVATRLGRASDCIQQTSRLGAARLLSLVATFKKLYTSTPEVIFSNLRSYILAPQKLYTQTTEEASTPYKGSVFVP